MGERYYQLSLLGRVSFIEAVAPAALVVHPNAPRQRRARGTDASELTGESSQVTPVSVNAVPYNWQPKSPELTILPLCKKVGTPFVDLVTVGRTSGNDLHLQDASVSRFHSFFRQRLGEWYLCDAGSRNGTKVGGKKLAPRTEAHIQTGDEILFGSVAIRFYSSDALFDLLAHSS